MILMTVDHASEVFNRGRVAGDSSGARPLGPTVDVAQFLTRWVTHLCAPTFVLLAGVSLALSTASRVARGDSPGAIDRHLATRGLVLILLEPLWMSRAMFAGAPEPGRVLLQVLYAIGASLLFMVPLRRLGDRTLLALGLALAIVLEPLLHAADALGLRQSIAVVLLAGPGRLADGHVIVGYPVLPWLAILCVGWVFGRRLLAWPAAERERKAARTLLGWGGALLVLFVAVRGANGPGNMSLLRDDGSLVQWLHTSKYPPSVSYDASELGLAALLLSGLLGVVQRRPGFAAPVRTLGEVALFYYLLHLHLMSLVAWALGVRRQLGLPWVWLCAAATLVALSPLCAWYSRYKKSHPGGWRQYV